MTRLFTPSKRAWMAVLVVVVVIVASVIAAVLVSAERSSADSDQATFEALILDFEQAAADASRIPENSLDTVKANLAEVARIATQTAGAADASVQILPASVRHGMDQARAAREEKYCSSAWQERHADDVSLSSIREAGLQRRAKDCAKYNSRYPLVVKGEKQLLACAVKSNDGKAAIVWTYTWYGEVTTNGNGGQHWEACEYRLVMESGQWRIDACSALVMAESTDETNEWGPYSPHTSIATAEQQMPSVVSSDPSTIQSQLEELAEIADKAASDK